MVQSWLINDYAVIYFLWLDNFYCKAIGNDWYTTNLPIVVNGVYKTSSGHIVEAHGVELRIRGRNQ